MVLSKSWTTATGRPSLLAGLIPTVAFTFGGERTTGQDTLRVLREGAFHGDSLEFTKRTTGLRGSMS